MSLFSLHSTVPGPGQVCRDRSPEQSPCVSLCLSPSSPKAEPAAHSARKRQSLSQEEEGALDALSGLCFFIHMNLVLEISTYQNSWQDPTSYGWKATQHVIQTGPSTPQLPGDG